MPSRNVEISQEMASRNVEMVHNDFSRPSTDYPREKDLQTHKAGPLFKDELLGLPLLATADWCSPWAPMHHMWWQRMHHVWSCPLNVSPWMHVPGVLRDVRGAKATLEVILFPFATHWPFFCQSDAASESISLRYTWAILLRYHLLAATTQVLAKFLTCVVNRSSYKSKGMTIFLWYQLLAATTQVLAKFLTCVLNRSS